MLLHGLPTWGYVWHPLMVLLARERRVLVPDLLGFGFSDRRDHLECGIEAQAELLDEWLGALGVEDVDVAGHDVGAGVALALALRSPRRIARLVLLDAACYDSWPIAALWMLGHPRVRRELSDAAVSRLPEVIVRRGFVRAPTNRLVEGLLAPYETEVGMGSLARGVAAMNAASTRATSRWLPEISAPTLIVWGAKDQFRNPSLARRLALDLRGAKTLLLAKAGHFVMYDRFREVVRAMRSFLPA